jgi:hypothetical protein
MIMPHPSAHAAPPAGQEEGVALVQLADHGRGLSHQRVGGADVVSEDVDHGHVVTDLLKTR